MPLDLQLRPRWRHHLIHGQLRPFDLLIVLVLLGATSGVGLCFADLLGETRLTMLYLTPVLICAVYLGVWAACGAAIGAVCLLNLLFAEPRFSFFVADYQDILTLVMFFAVAATTGILAGRLREQRDAARAYARSLRILATASDQLHEADSRERVVKVAQAALAELTERPAVVLSRQGQDGLTLATQMPESAPLQHSDFYAAERALSRGMAEPASAPGWNGSAYTFVPISLDDAESGADDIVLGHLRPPPGRRASPYEYAAAEVLGQQCGLALQRLHLARRVAMERERASTEALRAALLSSLSHDLRSPLAGILGSVTTLKDLGPALTKDARHDLLHGIEAETRRLAAYVANLLQLTRLQAGSPPQFQPIALADVIHMAEGRLRQMWPQARVRLNLPELPLIRADGALLEQAIFNLLDNAMRHGGGEITLDAETKGGLLHLTIADQGFGPVLDDGSTAAREAGHAGQGLGLRICAAIATALGGEMMTATNRQGGRAVTLCLPIVGSCAPGPFAKTQGDMHA